jgi:hypothetical protein
METVETINLVDEYNKLKAENARLRQENNESREEVKRYWTKYWDIAQAFEKRGNALFFICNMKIDPEFGAPPLESIQKVARRGLEKE